MMATQERKSILDMVATGKVSADEGERLLAALENGSQTAVAPVETGSGRAPKYLRVVVEQLEDGEPLKVNIRVPLQLLRAGVRLASLIPPRATQEIDTALAREGIAFNVAQLKPENLDELIDQLRDLTVDIDQEKDKLKVRIFCE
jgi:polyhydroxyalkanoate synthesis regulator phasin